MAKKDVCIKCGSSMKKGWCVDETCPFSDSVRKREWLQHCKNVNDIILHVPGFDPPIPNMKDPKVAAKVKAFIKKQKADAKPKSYLVTWTIDIEATSPEEAAIEALRIQQDMESEADHFEVKRKSTGKVSRINAKTALLNQGA